MQHKSDRYDRELINPRPESPLLATSTIEGLKDTAYLTIKHHIREIGMLEAKFHEAVEKADNIKIHSLFQLLDEHRRLMSRAFYHYQSEVGVEVLSDTDKARIKQAYLESTTKDE